MDVISLAPNITDILCKLNFEDNLIGCTKYHNIKGADNVGGWPVPNIEKVKELDPDVIFTSDPMQDEITDYIDPNNYDIFHTNPTRFLDLYDMILFVGDKINRKDKSISVVNNINKTVNHINNHKVDDKPIVYCEEWDNPTKVSGNWIPDIVNIAGGYYPFLNSGERSRNIKYKEFKKNDPDIFISHVCGFGLQDRFREVRDDWNMTNSDVYFVDENYMNNLSTRSIKGIKILCEIINNDSYGLSKHYKSVNID